METQPEHTERYGKSREIHPICSMYCIFAYIWVILLGQMLVNIPYMEHMGMVLVAKSKFYQKNMIYLEKHG